MRRPFDLSLYLVLDPDQCGPRGWLETVEPALSGGVSVVQLRCKDPSDGRLAEMTRALLPQLRARSIPLLLNDHVELAARLEVDGVHLGQDDASPASARRLLGPRALIGLSVTRAAEVSTVDPEVVDYVGLGPVFPTDSKADAAKPLLLEGFRAVRAALPLPVVAIGGVSLANAAQLRAAGADGLAVISAICRAPDPRAAASGLRRAMDGGRP